MYSLLYVDDAEDLRELGKLYLEAIGDFSVTTAESADRALALLRDRSFDLILSDFDMPGMDGIRFLTRVREQYRDIPFILFTARGRDEIVEEAIGHGADFYIQKGIDTRAQFAELAHKIRQAVRRQQAETALAVSRDYLDKIFSSVRAGIVIVDAATHRIIDINPAATLMIGAQKEEILGKVCHRYICPAEQGRCPICDLGQDVDNSERVLLTAAGKEVPLIKYVTPVELFHRACLLETFIDNTDRKEAEKKLRAAYERLILDQEELHAAYAKIAANEQLLENDYGKLMQSERQLQESNAELRELFESAGDAILVASGDGVFLRCNRNALAVFGYSGEPEILGRTLAGLSPEFQPDGSRSADRIREEDGQKGTGQGTVFSLTCTRRDGTVFPAEISRNTAVIGDRTFIQYILRDSSHRDEGKRGR
jgi:PAS domain S-box-containing protein